MAPLQRSAPTPRRWENSNLLVQPTWPRRRGASSCSTLVTTGGNSSHPAAIQRQVVDGRGRTKACNTTGTATNSGYPEHAFTWDVAQRVRTKLMAAGYVVEMTRSNDDGIGPCVDERAAIANRAAAAALVSIHADGSNQPGAHGFHISHSDPPLNAAQQAPSHELAAQIRSSMRTADFADSTYLGHGGIYPRADLAGLNLSKVPAVLIECGNMRDPGDATVITDSDGRERYAQAIADGIQAWMSP